MIQLLLSALAMGGFYFAFRIVHQLFGDLQDALDREQRELQACHPDPAGLSLNARLEAAGLRKEFRRAVADWDTHRMDAILRRLEERYPARPDPPFDPS